MKVGLILEGGAMRGIFTAGVLEYMLKEDFRPDAVYGVSAGACHGCSFVCGQKGRAYAVATDYVGDPAYASFRSLRKTGDFFGADFIYHKIPEELYPIDNEAFKERGIEFRVAVTNCATGQAEYPQVRDMFKDIDWVRASASMPVFARMVPMAEGVYLDGGIADSIPLKAAQEAGCGLNIVVLTQPRDYVKKPAKSPFAALVKAKYRRYPEMLKTLERRAEIYNEETAYIFDQEKQGNTFVVAPVKPLGISRLEMDKAKLRRAYLEGYYVMEALWPNLKKFLEERR